MNISIDGLTTMHSKLEKEYKRLEKEITNLYNEDKDINIIRKKEQEQDLVDEQLDLIDLIIRNLENTPKMYDELMRLNKEYKSVIGD